MLYPSAGHHSKDPGAVANGYTEFELVSDFRDRITEYLDILNVVYDTDKDHETNSQYQGRIRPKLRKGDVVLDNHLDSYNGKVSGVTVFISNNAGEDSKAFAKDLSEGISKIMGVTNRGVKKEGDTQHSRIGILNLKGTAALVEYGFMDNPNDLKAFLDNRDTLAKFVCSMMLKYDRNQYKDYINGKV